MLEACQGRPGCPSDGTRWRSPKGVTGEALGVRLVLAELARRRPGIPFGLVPVARGGAGIADLLDPARPGRAPLVLMAQAAAPASALVILAHGTTDAERARPPADYVAGIGALADMLREAGGDPAMPVLLAPLTPLRDAAGLLGSGRLADAVGLVAGDGWPFRLGLAQRRPLPPKVVAGAAAIRAAQAAAARCFGLLPGGDMAAVETGADGIHWSAAGLRRVAREVASAIDAALPPTPAGP